MKKREEEWIAKLGAWVSLWKYDTIARFFLFILLGVVIFSFVIGHVVPETYEFKLHEISPQTVESPKQFVDVRETERIQREAAAKIVVQFAKNEQIMNQQLQQLDHIFRTAENVIPDDQFTEEQKVNIIKRSIPYDLSEEAYYKFTRIPSESLLKVKLTAKRFVQEIMVEGVRSEDLGGARSKVNEMLVSTDLEKNEREVVLELARSSITQNLFIDEEKTQELRELAISQVSPIYVNKNDVLVKEGERITSEVMERLELAGLLKNQKSYMPHIGLAILISMLVALLFLFIRQSHLDIRYNNVHLLMLIVVYSVNVLGMKILSAGQDLNYLSVGYMAPVAFGTLILTILLDYRIAFFSAIIFSSLASIIFNMESNTVFDYRFGLVALMTCLVSIFAISNIRHQRSEVLKVGFIVSATAILTVGAILLLSDEFQWIEFAPLTAYGLVNGVLTTVLTIGLLPFFEAAFGILSSVKLIELSSPNHPLLRKLLTETPGTYHHSVMVGNLSEAAAEAIGANGLLCRVGSFYHDIGKSVRPTFFIENQMGMENPHDRLDPSLSASIILAHPTDGVKMLKQHRIPRAIRDIAEQHHGTTLLKYFYHKAIKQAPEGKEISELDYRYPGPKAQTKEAAIVGIADCVEAAVRSLTGPTPEQIETIVRNIIKNRLDDGQFNECDLTLKELEQVAQSICETLLGIFHSRIEYPSEDELKGVRQA
jgi:putative nucleotidyltransferase with HDIG domain